MSTRLIARTVLSIVGTVSMVLAVGLPYRSTSAAATWVDPSGLEEVDEPRTVWLLFLPALND